MQPKEVDCIQEAAQMHDSFVRLPQLMVRTAEPEVQLQAAMIFRRAACIQAPSLSQICSRVYSVNCVCGKPAGSGAYTTVMQAL